MSEDGMHDVPGMVSSHSPTKSGPAKTIPEGVKVDDYRVWFDETCFSELPREAGARAGASGEGTDIRLSEDQAIAYDSIMKWYRGSESKLLTLGGYAGTGKSTLVSLLARELSRERVSFVAFTGKATLGLRRKLIAQGSLGERHDTRTFHSLIYQSFANEDGDLLFALKKEGALKDLDLVVLEEASMPPDFMTEALMQTGVRVLAVGDHGQLPPVMGKSSLMANPDLRLEKIHRQAADNPIIELSRIIREDGDLPRSPPGGNDNAITYVKQADIEKVMRSVYFGDETGKGNGQGQGGIGVADSAVIAWTNGMRTRLNKGLRHLYFQGTEPPDRPRPGDRVVCLKNAKKKVFNGMLGFIDEVHETESPNFLEGVVRFPDDGIAFRGSFLKPLFLRPQGIESFSDFADSGLVVEEWDDYGLQLDYGYALTCHKAQGSQWNTVGVVRERVRGTSSDNFRRWLYTAVTRASEKLYVFV